VAAYDPSLDFECPVCGAPVLERCVLMSGNLRSSSHVERNWIAKDRPLKRLIAKASPAGDLTVNSAGAGFPELRIDSQQPELPDAAHDGAFDRAPAVNSEHFAAHMSHLSLYPLRFEPIYQYRPWGGRRLAEFFSAPLPGEDPVGEAWVLSDRDDHQSQVANGWLKGHALSEVMEQFREPLMGKLASCFHRFPLLLKFLDAREMLSVQVHPSDAQPDLIPAGESGKTEAWVVIEASSGSRIYAGLEPGTTANDLRRSLVKGTIVEHLVNITPRPGDAVFIPAGTVHTLGGGTVVFEVQQNSDVTFRLYDWGHVDAKTGKLRPLQIDQALATIDFAQSTEGLVLPFVETTIPVVRERLFDCHQFLLWRLRGRSPFTVGTENVPSVLVCIDGQGQLESAGVPYVVEKGEVWLLPAVAGMCAFHPDSAVTLLEIAPPNHSERINNITARRLIDFIESASFLKRTESEKSDCL
jgi:mannose-6-phosphate isomerase